jgi:hypothetical protein
MWCNIANHEAGAAAIAAVGRLIIPEIIAAAAAASTSEMASGLIVWVIAQLEPGKSGCVIDLYHL